MSQNRLSEYDLIADGVEAILATRKPRVEGAGGLNSRVLMPPVAVLQDCFLEGDDGFFAPEDVPPDLFDYVNVAVVNRNVTDMPGTWAFWWVRTASQKERRGCRFFSKHMLTVSTGGIHEGRWIDLATHVVSFIGGKWRDATGATQGGSWGSGYKSGSVWSKIAFGASWDDTVRMQLSIALNMRYWYSVVLSDDPNCLAARLYGDPRTIRFLLRTRDLGNEHRRRALLHLVRSHRRRRRKTFNVGQHLRGEHRCRWVGLDVAVLPSQFDLETSTGAAVPDRLKGDGLLRWVGA